MLGNKRDPETGRDRAAERQRQRQRETFQSKASIETHCSLREPWALWEPGKNGKPEALPSGTSGLACPCTLLLNLGSLTEPPPKQTIARTLVWAQLVALDCFTSGTFLCLPASRLEVSQGARPRSCSQIPPPYSLGAGSKRHRRLRCECYLVEFLPWQRGHLIGSRIGHHIPWGGGQSAECLAWGRKQTLELRARRPTFPEPRRARHSRPSLCSPGAWAGPPSFQLSYLGCFLHRELQA